MRLERQQQKKVGRGRREINYKINKWKVYVGINMVETKEKEIVWNYTNDYVKIQISYCNKCKKYGFLSIYPTKEGKLQCTDCANRMRFEI